MVGLGGSKREIGKEMPALHSPGLEETETQSDSRF